MNDECELCRLAPLTPRYYVDKEVVICDCLTCGIPMLVFRHHGEASEEERRRAMNTIDTLFEYEHIRREPRQIFDHEHWHIEGAKTKPP